MLTFAHGSPCFKAQIKHTPDDFCVEEHLGYELTGTGEHLFLRIEKTGLNTEEMARIIAKSLQLPLKAISYAGLKDKFAKTIQWFSVHLPGLADPPLDCLTTTNHRLLKTMRHHKKLKIGALKENHFIIKLHHLETVDTAFMERLEIIKKQGVPNYFGPQRFGHQGANLIHAKALLLDHKKIKNRHLRGLYYSAARSFLFNQIVSCRVGAGLWNQAIEGDLMMLVGSHSVFPIDTVNDDIIKRMNEQDICPAAPLWGMGRELLTGSALEFQQIALEPWKAWCNALEALDFQKAYRSMMLFPEHLEYQADVISFTLPSGSYATTVLRELISFMD